MRFRIGSPSCTRVGSWRWGPCATSSASRSTPIREVCSRRLLMVLCAAVALRRYQARQLTSPRSLRDVPSHRDANTSNLPAQPLSHQNCGMMTRAWCAVSKRLSDETWYAPPWARPRPCPHLMCRRSLSRQEDCPACRGDYARIRKLTRSTTCGARRVGHRARYRRRPYQRRSAVSSALRERQRSTTSVSTSFASRR